MSIGDTTSERADLERAPKGKSAPDPLGSGRVFAPMGELGAAGHGDDA